jgi:hypothetical protein
MVLHDNACSIVCASCEYESPKLLSELDDLLAAGLPVCPHDAFMAALDFGAWWKEKRSTDAAKYARLMRGEW